MEAKMIAMQNFELMHTLIEVNLKLLPQQNRSTLNNDKRVSKKILLNLKKNIDQLLLSIYQAKK